MSSSTWATGSIDSIGLLRPESWNRPAGAGPWTSDPEQMLSMLKVDNRREAWNLFLLSWVVLFLELVLIRWISSEIRVFAYLKNLPLIACFLGLGLGCARARASRDFMNHFPLPLGILCLGVAFSGQLGLTFLPFPIGDYLIVGDVSGGFDYSHLSNKMMALGKFLAVILAVWSLCVYLFFSLGQRLGRLLETFAPLTGYTINIAGSLAGVLSFALISFAGWPPLVWFAVCFAPLGLLVRARLKTGLILAVTLLAIALVPGQAVWSPYYRIDVSPLRADPEDPGSVVIGHDLRVNHDYHQRMLDLSAGAPVHPLARRAQSYYDLIYRFVNPRDVLIVGAGSGNDAASALRHGAQRVDAVEIDPRIIQLGRQLHPEKPYHSERVRVINHDARAFFKQSHDRYDLIVFGLLDSQTLLSSMSSIRLDNYIYTLESLREARAHLKPGGTLSLSFALTEVWLQERFYRMLLEAFDQEPLCLQTPYDSGISYIVGPTANREFLQTQPDLAALVINDRIPRSGLPIPRDDWPFLYLKEKTVPFVYWFTLCALFGLSLFWIRGTLLASKAPFHLYMFLLGMGFMLIEVKSITDLSLLFGSTWLVNSVVISGILLMILMANYVVAKFSPTSKGWIYAGLVLTLLLSYFLEPDLLAGLSFEGKALLGALVSSCPLFFAGILFACAFREVGNVPAAFGANLLGALVGGILENASMVYGVAFLNLLAIGIYLLSAMLLFRPAWHTAKSRAPS